MKWHPKQRTCASYVVVLVVLVGSVATSLGNLQECQAGDKHRIADPIDAVVAMLEIKLHQMPVAEAPELPDRGAVWNAFRLLKEENLPKALVEIETASEVLKSSSANESDDALASILCGVIHHRLGDFGYTLKYLSRDEATNEDGFVDAERAMLMHLLAESLALSGKFREAVSALKYVEALRSSLPDESEVAVCRTLRDLVFAHCQLGQLLQAAELCKAIENCYPEGTNHGVAIEYLKLTARGYLAFENWNYGQAVEYFDEARRLVDEEVKITPIEQIRLLTMCGLSHAKNTQIGRIKNSQRLRGQELINQAISIAEKRLGKKHPAYVRSVLCSAEVNMLMHNLDVAGYLLESVKEEATGAELPYLLHLLARHYRHGDKWKEAENAFELSAIAYKTAGQLLHYADARLAQAAWCDRNNRNHSLAFYRFLEIDKLTEETLNHSHPLRMQIKLRTAEELYYLGKYDASLALFETVTNDYSDHFGTEHPMSINCNAWRGVLHVKLNQPEEGAMILSAVLAQMNELGHPKGKHFQFASSALETAERELGRR